MKILLFARLKVAIQRISDKNNTNTQRFVKYNLFEDNEEAFIFSYS